LGNVGDGFRVSTAAETPPPDEPECHPLEVPVGAFRVPTVELPSGPGVACEKYTRPEPGSGLVPGGHTALSPLPAVSTINGEV